MPIRYFKKHNPNVKLWMPSGHALQFAQIGKYGYMRSDSPEIAEDPKILTEIDLGIKTEIGGVREISASQWEDEYVKKNLSPQYQGSRTNWREEFGLTVGADTVSPRVSEKAAVAASADPVQPAADAPPVRSLRDRANFGVTVK